jgi:hypothetical protein
MIAAGLYDAMLDAGFNPPDSTSGEITRFSTNGKTHNKDGWLVVFDDSGACFGCWREGTRFTWSDKSKFESMSSEERDAFEFKRRMAMQQAEFEREQRQNFAASESLEEWQNAPVCESHAYLDYKSVSACENLRVGLDGRLIVPVFESSEKIQSLQYIDSEGKKQFKTDGKMKGGFFVVGDIGADCYLCEGLATGLTINSATGKGVIVAFSASNMPVVYDKLKAGRVVTVCADNDAHGVGLKYANECKGAKVVFPQIINGKPTDFNDLGIEGCKSFFGVGIEKNLFRTLADMKANIKPPQWIIKGIIERGSLCLLFGESGAGKSLFALDWACCIANGRDWHGHKVKEQGAVFYIQGEGERGIAMREQAIEQKYEDPTNPTNLMVSHGSTDFLDIAQINEIIASIDAMVDMYGITPVCCVIDTLNRNMIGDENSAEDVARYLKGVEMVSKKYNCAILTVHHSGLGDKNRVRGSSALRAGHDAEFCVTKNNKTSVTFSCTKSKDFEAGAPLNFQINKVKLIGDCFYDEDIDDNISSVHLVYDCVSKGKEADKKENSIRQKILNAMKKAFDDGNVIDNDDGLGGLVSLKANPTEKLLLTEKWKEYISKELKHDDSKKLKEQVCDARKALKASGDIDFDGIYNWLVELENI